MTVVVFILFCVCISCAIKIDDLKKKIEVMELFHEGRIAYFDNELASANEWVDCWRARALDLQRKQQRQIFIAVDKLGNSADIQ